ncbi:olfactory receptor 5V1-like [Discoglossus pictus]
MISDNQSTTAEFILLGFTNDNDLQNLLFYLFFIIYLITLSGNVLLIVSVLVDHRLHSPMYFFLTNLSFIDICYTSITVPKILVNLLSKKKRISYTGCLVQVYFYLFFGASECLILTFMAYDRFVAICNPLHYTVVMNKMTCIQFSSLSFMTGFAVSSVDMFFICHLTYCGHNTINHFFCEAPLLQHISCNDNIISNIVKLVGGIIVLLIPLIFILCSYIHIIATIMRSHSGRVKVFYTCTSHLLVVALYFGPGIFVNMWPRHSVSATDKVVSVFYTIITPMLNPLIYSLRNKDVHRALGGFHIPVNSNCRS